MNPGKKHLTRRVTAKLLTKKQWESWTPQYPDSSLHKIIGVLRFGSKGTEQNSRKQNKFYPATTRIPPTAITEGWHQAQSCQKTLITDYANTRTFLCSRTSPAPHSDSADTTISKFILASAILQHIVLSSYWNNLKFVIQVSCLIPMALHLYKVQRN